MVGLPPSEGLPGALALTTSPIILLSDRVLADEFPSADDYSFFKEPCIVFVDARDHQKLRSRSQVQRQ